MAVARGAVAENSVFGAVFVHAGLEKFPPPAGPPGLPHADVLPALMRSARPPDVLLAYPTLLRLRTD